MNIDRILFYTRRPGVCFAEADAVEAGGVAEVADPLEAALAEGNGEGDQLDPEEFELEIGPEKVKVNKPVKEAWDNLQKSVQSRAEEIKAEKAAVAAERTRAQEFQKHFEAVADEVAEIKSLDKQIGPYLKLTPADWMAWAEQDADAARKAQTGLQAMLTQRTQLMGSAQAKIQDITTKQTAAQTEARTKAEAEVAAKIPGWNATQRQELVTKLAKETGRAAEEIEPYMYDAGVISLMRDALELRALKAKVAAKNNAPAPPTPEPQPKAPAARGGGGNSLGDNVPIDQWAKNFRKQMRGG